MKKLIFSFLIVVVASSCGDLLDETPKDFISPQNFYETEKDLEAALSGVYQTMWVRDLQCTYYNYINLHTDYASARGSYTSVGNFDKVLGSDTYDRLNSFWRYHYMRINRANVVLERGPQVGNIAENVRDRILAEAHFLRAFSYFQLLRYWGPVPLRTVEFSGERAIDVPRATKGEVYDLILSDLAIADRDLPKDVGSATGRASKWAAKMLMAQVYLDMEDWPAAAEKADEVIKSNKYSLVTVGQADDYYKIFAVKTFSSEEIMSYHFSQNVKPTFQEWYHGQGTPYNRGVTRGFTNLPNPETPFIQDWDENDLRKGFNLYSSYMDDNGTMVHLTGVGSTRYKKFIKDPSGDALYIIPIYRLAEAYLMYAEASCMANGSPTTLGLERLNATKRRAYGYSPDVVSPVDFPAGMGRDDFRDAVIQERGYEFFMESLRWWDLKRTGKAQERITEASGKTFIDHRLLFPIPQPEMETNKAITQADQNPGY
ncbi:MAG TPA: RagB/SusD family nutrient uptake outer membrane protein [Chryseosolibacter sp.]